MCLAHFLDDHCEILFGKFSFLKKKIEPEYRLNLNLLHVNYRIVTHIRQLALSYVCDEVVFAISEDVHMLLACSPSHLI